MKITGKTQSIIDKENADREALLLIDNAQKEADELLNSIIRKMALDKLVEISNV